jgi:hypothetical protein
MSARRTNVADLGSYSQVVLPTPDTLLCRGTSLFLPPDDRTTRRLVAIPRVYKQIIDQRRFSDVLGYTPAVEPLFTTHIRDFTEFVLHQHLRYDEVVSIDPAVDVCFLDVSDTALCTIIESSERRLRALFGEDARLNARSYDSKLHVVATLPEAQAELELNGYAFAPPRLGELNAAIANDYLVKIDNLSDPDAFTELAKAVQVVRTPPPSGSAGEVTTARFLDVADYARVIGHDPIPNQFLVLMEFGEGDNGAVARTQVLRMRYQRARFEPVDGDAILKEISPIWKPPQPLELAQIMALDILLDDDIELAFVSGPQQSGKTLLALVGAQTRIFGRGLLRQRKLPMEKQIKLIKSGLPEGIRQEELLGEYAHFKNAFSELAIGIVPFEEMLRPQMERKHKGTVSGSDDWREVLSRAIVLPEKAPFDLVSPERIQSMTFTGYTIRDECQNEYPHVMEAFIGRKGPGAKIIVLGDLCDQITRPGLDEHWNGLLLALSKYKRHPNVAAVKLTRTWSGMAIKQQGGG